MTVYAVLDYYDNPVKLLGIYSTREKAINKIMEYLDADGILQEFINVDPDYDTIEDVKEYYKKYFKEHNYDEFSDLKIIATELI